MLVINIVSAFLNKYVECNLNFNNSIMGIQCRQLKLWATENLVLFYDPNIDLYTINHSKSIKISIILNTVHGITDIMTIVFFKTYDAC